MQPYISIVCQNDGHHIALEYAKLVSELNLPILVNFPSEEKYEIASNADQFLGPLCGNDIDIISERI